MGKKCLKHCTVFFCLLLFLQETHCIIRPYVDLQQQSKPIRSKEKYGESKRFVRTEDDDIVENNSRLNSIDEYHHETQNKRFTWVAAGYTALTALTGLSIVASLGAVAVEARLTDAGCCDSYDTCDNVKEYEKLYKQVAAKSTEIDALYLAAENRMENAIEINTIADELLSAISTFDTYSDIVFELIDSEITNKFNNESELISKAIDVGNATLSSLAEMTFEYQSSFKDPFSLGVTIAGVIMTLGYPFYKASTHMKSKRAAQALALDKKLAVTGKPNPLFKGSKLIKGSATSITKSTFTFKGVMSGLSGLMSIVGIAGAVWDIVKKFEQCAQAETDSYKAVKDLKVAKTNADQLWTNATNLKKDAYDNYNDVKKILIDEGFLLYCNDVAQLLGNASEQTDDVIEARLNVEEYIKRASNPDVSTHEFYNLTTKLVSGFNNVNHQMYCLSRKIEGIMMANSECASGSDALETLYKKATSKSFENVNCTLSGYLTYHDFKGYIEKEMIRTGLQTDCILNNKNLKLRVCNSWYTGTVNNFGITAKQEDYFISVCPAGDGTGPQITSLLCYNKHEGMDEATVVKTYYKYNSREIRSEYKKCPYKELSDNTVDLVCLMKKSRSSLTTVLTFFVPYDPALIESTYKSCPTPTWQDSDFQIMCFAFNMKSNPRDSTKAYEDMLKELDGTYGAKEVDRKSKECTSTVKES